jgi:diacylglycerol kinase family enzyme
LVVESSAVSLSELKVGAIINTSSGGCDLESEQKMLDILRDAGIVGPKTWCGEAEEMERFFTEAARQKLDIFIVLGGDGTIRKAAEACGETRPYLIPLPGGTMNMLPRGLYGELSWEEALRNTLAAPSARILSGGRVMNEQFFVAAIVGTPALWIQARESVREGDIIGLIEKGRTALQKTFGTKVRYLISEEMNGEAEAVVLICPLISEEMPGSEKALEVAVVEVENAAEVIRFATIAAFRNWRDDRKVELTKTKRLAVQSSKEIPATLDGESVSLGRRAEFDFVSRAATVLVPAK